MADMTILKTEDSDFLKKYLSPEQIIHLSVALLAGTPVLISGRADTGKTTVCHYLRKRGADVREFEEVEKGAYIHEKPESNKNNVYINIVLNKSIEG
ncbi:MAG TPA: hypothetical protein IAD10_08530 [Candidatus Fimicola cottocaccae]|nr:hypothetical protein [Candidatus Fimicola cottocaccae]